MVSLQLYGPCAVAVRYPVRSLIVLAVAMSTTWNSNLPSRTDEPSGAMVAGRSLARLRLLVRPSGVRPLGQVGAASELMSPHAVMTSAVRQHRNDGRRQVSRSTEQSRSWHCFGPRDMPFEAKRSRHVAVARLG